MPQSKLNEKQNRFCLEYIKDWNGTQAAERAGYAKSGAGVHAFKLLKNAKIRAMIGDHVKSMAAATGITVKKVLREYALLAFSSVEDFFTITDQGDMVMRSGEAMGKEKIRAIQSVDRVETTFTSRDGDVRSEVKLKFKLWDKNKALDSLAKHLGLFVPEDPDPAKTVDRSVHITQIIQAEGLDKKSPEELLEFITNERNRFGRVIGKNGD